MHLTKLFGNSLFLFTPTNQLRIYLFKLIKTDLFEYLVCFFVLLLTFLRLFDSPKYYENLLFSFVGSKTLSNFFKIKKRQLLTYFFNFPPLPPFCPARFNRDAAFFFYSDTSMAAQT